MKNKIVLILISLFLLYFSAKAATPLDPSATAYPTTFSVYLAQSREVLVHVTPYDDSSYMIEGLSFEIEGDTIAVPVVSGLLSGMWKTFTVYGAREGKYEITIIIKGYQKEIRTGLRTNFAIKVKLTVTVEY